MFRLSPCPSWGSPDVLLFKLQFYSTLLTSGAVFAGIPLHLIAFTEQNISNSRPLSAVYMLMTAFTCRVQYLCGSAPHESLSFRFELIVWRSPNWQERLSHLATHSLGFTYMRSPFVTSSPPFLAFEWLNHVLKCILELREKSSRLQKLVQFFNSTPIWMHRRGHFPANSGWLKMRRVFLLLWWWCWSCQADNPRAEIWAHRMFWMSKMCWKAEIISYLNEFRIKLF